MSNGNRMPPRDYLELERRSEARHEYMLGEAMQVPGGSPNHSLMSQIAARLSVDGLREVANGFSMPACEFAWMSRRRSMSIRT